MKPQILSICLVVLPLLGCAGTDLHGRVLEIGGDLRIDSVQSPTHDYAVYVKNVVDIGYDGENPETRQATVLQALRQQCPGGKVIGEDVIDRGSYLFRPARTYVLKVKCRPA